METLIVLAVVAAFIGLAVALGLRTHASTGTAPEGEREVVEETPGEIRL